MKLTDEDYFEFSNDIPDMSDTLNFNAKFKIIDTKTGYKLFIHKIFKRSISKEKLVVLEDIISLKFPINFNDVSGIDLSDIKMNKIYNGEFELISYSNNDMDVFVNPIID